MFRPVNSTALSVVLALVIVAVGFCAIAQAAPLGFAIDLGAPSALFSVDLGAGTAAAIGPTGIDIFRSVAEGLALSPGGTLFASDNNGRLYSIDPITGAATPIAGNTLRGAIEGLDFNGSTLLGVDFNVTPTIFSIDTTTLATTDIITVASQTGVSRTLSVVDGSTVLLVTDGPVLNTLRSVDLATGATTVIGTIGGGGQVFGIDFASDGLLYGVNDVGEVLLIDPVTAGTTVLGDAGAVLFLGLAAAPQAVSVPSTLFLLIAGLIPIAAARLVRRRNPA